MYAELFCFFSIILNSFQNLFYLLHKDKAIMFMYCKCCYLNSEK